MTVTFTVLGEPTGKGRPRFARNDPYVRTYTPDKTVVYENLVRIEYERQCKAYRFEDTAYLDMRIYAYYGIPKSVSKKKRAAMLAGEIRPAKKPDMDNVIKAIADALNNVAYKDDTQIVDTMIRKFYAEQPMVKVVLRTAEKIKRTENHDEQSNGTEPER